MTTITADQVKKHLIGLDPWLAVASASGIIPYDDAYIAGSIVPAAIRRFERELQFRVNQVQVAGFPDGVSAPAIGQAGPGLMGGIGGVLPDGYPLPSGTPWLSEEPYGYWTSSFNQYGLISLKMRPVLQVQRYRLIYNQGMDVYDLPVSWLHWDNRAGTVWILPTGGAALVGSAYLALSALALGFGSADYVPGLITLDYVAGLAANWQSDPQWYDLQRALEQCCAYCILEDISQAFDPGMASASIGVQGFSQNLNYERFERRKAEIQQSYQSFKTIFQADQGFGVFVGSV